MWQYIFTNELYHHGTIGMKWGVRRYQNKDGTLTERGKKRYYNEVSENDTKKKDNRAKLSKYDEESGKLINNQGDDDDYSTANRWVKNDIKNKRDIVNAGEKITRESSKIVDQLPSMHKREKLDLSNMSDQELRDKINRSNLERQYNDIYNPERVSKGRENVKTALEIGGSVLGITGSALSIALAIRELAG